MNDNPDENIRQIPPRAFQSSAEHDAKLVAHNIQQKRMTEWRSAVRQDAVVMVERARERAGFSRTAWTPLEADTLHTITDLLLQIQAQEVPRA